MFPEMPLPTTMVRPLNAANDATTSSMVALSHWALMRGAWDCWASLAWSARYSSTLTGSPAGSGGATVAAVDATGGGAAGWAAGCGAAAAAADWDDQLANAVRSVPSRTVTLPSPRWI